MNYGGPGQDMFNYSGLQFHAIIVKLILWNIHHNLCAFQFKKKRTFVHPHTTFRLSVGKT